MNPELVSSILEIQNGLQEISINANVGGLGGPSGRVEARAFLSDRNVLWDTTGLPPLSGNGTHGLHGREGLAKAFTPNEWQALGYDRSSVFADPLLNDPARGDMSPRPGSPAFTLGFEPIVLSDVGPRPKDRRD